MVPFAGLLAALEQIPDPRRRQGQRYGLAPLLLFAVLAVLAGATSYRRIRLFIGVHRERLNATFGARFRRAPAVNTLRALLHALDAAAFRRHAQHLGDVTTAPGRRVIALDGKTLRGSFDHLDDQAAAQVLSAFASEAALILAHQEIAEGDEVAAAQALIEQLGLHGVLFTADALHRQKNVRLRDRDRQRTCWCDSSPTSPACMRPWRDCAPSGTRSTGTRRRTAVGTAVRSTGASRSSRWRISFHPNGRGRSPVRPASHA